MKLISVSPNDSVLRFIGNEKMQTNVMLGIAAFATKASPHFRGGLWEPIRTFTGEVFLAPKIIQGNFVYDVVTINKHGVAFPAINVQLFGLYVTYSFFIEITNKPQYQHLQAFATRLKDYAASQFMPEVHAALFATPWRKISSDNLPQWQRLKKR